MSPEEIPDLVFVGGPVDDQWVLQAKTLNSLWTYNGWEIITCPWYDEHGPLPVRHRYIQSADNGEFIYVGALPT